MILGIVATLCALTFSQRDIAGTDVIYVEEADGTIHKCMWSDVELFVEQNIDDIDNALDYLTVDGKFNYGTVAGTADSINLTCSPVVTELTAGLIVYFVADSANTGAATLVVDGLAEKNIYEASDISELDAGDIAAGMAVQLLYDGTQWQQISQSGN